MHADDPPGAIVGIVEEGKVGKEGREEGREGFVLGRSYGGS